MSRMHLDVLAMREQSRMRAADRPRGPELPLVEDAIVPDTPGVRARHYRPDGSARRPLLVYLHGGFWVLGGLESHDRLCRRIAAESDVEVLAVDYRLAPEHPWPAAVDDAVTAAQWAASWLAGGAPVAIGGDSAGGCIAALAALRLRDDGTTALRAQVLLCPNTDLTGSQPSMTEKATGFGLEAAAVRAAASLWVPGHARHASGDVSPLHAPSLEGLPPTLVVTAEHDPLRDEGNAYANRLCHAGVEVSARTEPALSHGFYLDTTDTAGRATHHLLTDMKSLLHG